MRRFLVASIVFLAACGDDPVENQMDSSAVDSSAVIKDTALLHPRSTVLDTIPSATNAKLIYPDRTETARILNLLTAGKYQLLDTATGDLNGDEYGDLLIILKSSEEDSLPESPRPLIVMIGENGSTYKSVSINDSVALCKGCGGIWGDPYDGMTIKNGYFSIEHYGGSNWRWTKIITFKYSEKEKTWLLHRDAGVSYNTGDPEGTETETVERKDEYGKLKFVDYDYN